MDYMGKQTIHMKVVRDILAKEGLEVVDLGCITTGESSYGIYLEEGQRVTVMDNEHKMSMKTFEEIKASLDTKGN